LNRTVCGVIFNVRIGKDFGLKNSVFYIRTVLTENNKFLCIFSFTVFIVNEYFTTVTKLKICAHHLLLTIILSILKCVTLYQVTIIPSYLYSQMRELKILKIFNTSHFVTWLFSELYSLQTQSNFDRYWGRSFVDRKFCQYIFCNIFIGIVAQSSRLL
jgi:hypothetical protein